MAMKSVCRDYMHERCKYGDDCRYAHDSDLCFHWWKSEGKSCEEGDECQWNHFLSSQKKKDKKESEPSGSKKAAEKQQQHSSKTGNTRSRKEEKDSEKQHTGTTTVHAPKKVFETAKGGSRGKRKGYGAKNTESFTPSHVPPTMRVHVDLSPVHFNTPIQVRDVGVYPCIFSQPEDKTIYERLLQELKDSSVPEKDLLKSWHGDSHVIADDSTGWKKQSPTFNMVIERVRQYFGMDIKATRFNWYRDQSEWKPYHHDAAAVKPDKAKTQNFTVAVSFGSTRTAAFEEVNSHTTVAMPQPDGSVYTFSRDVNIMWRHGILQVPPELQKPEGRISIIAWGWVDQAEV